MKLNSFNIIKIYTITPEIVLIHVLFFLILSTDITSYIVNFHMLNSARSTRVSNCFLIYNLSPNLEMDLVEHTENRFVWYVISGSI